MTIIKTSGEVEELQIKVPWGMVSAKCWNSRESSPVLVAHGLCENAGSFGRLVPLLSKNFYYVVVDLPGHGWSSPFPEGLPLDFMNYVGQLQRIVSHFRWKKFVRFDGSQLRGSSPRDEFFAAAFTTKVERLILLDAISPTPVAGEIFLLFHRNRVKEVSRLEEGNGTPTLLTYEEAPALVADRRTSKLKPEAPLSHRWSGACEKLETDSCSQRNTNRHEGR